MSPADKRSSVEVFAGYSVFLERIIRGPEARGTMLFVNGALATTTSFRWAVSALPDYDLILFDYPSIGQSRPHNPDVGILGIEEEARILRAVCDRYQPDYVVSMSWGGTPLLLVLSDGPRSVKKAILASYSLMLTPDMRQLAVTLERLIDDRQYERAARLTLESLGELLPARIKSMNERYFVNLTPGEKQYVLGHLRRVLSLNVEHYASRLANVRIPLMFINGTRDRFTSCSSVTPVSRYVRNARFVAIEDTGHFLPLESKRASAALSRALFEFLAEPAATAPMVPAATAYADA